MLVQAAKLLLHDAIVTDKTSIKYISWAKCTQALIDHDRDETYVRYVCKVANFLRAIVQTSFAAPRAWYMFDHGYYRFVNNLQLTHKLRSCCGNGNLRCACLPGHSGVARKCLMVGHA